MSYTSSFCRSWISAILYSSVRSTRLAERYVCLVSFAWSWRTDLYTVGRLSSGSDTLLTIFRGSSVCKLLAVANTCAYCIRDKPGTLATWSDTTDPVLSWRAATSPAYTSSCHLKTTGSVAGCDRGLRLEARSRSGDPEGPWTGPCARVYCGSSSCTAAGRASWGTVM